MKIGDKVNALIFPDQEVVGIIKEIDGHYVKIEKSDDKSYVWESNKTYVWAVKTMVKVLE